MSRLHLPFLAALASAILVLAAGGCAWTQEERDFYGRGWVNPRELDRPAPYRGPRPVAGEGGTTDGTPASRWPTASDIGRQ